MIEDEKIKKIDKKIVWKMREWGIWLLRISLGLVFLWFGLLKVFGVSPVSYMIEETYTFTKEYPIFIVIIGVWEILIGLGLICNYFLRLTIILLWLQMAGIFFSIFLYPQIFYDHNPLILTLEGEFVLKNFVILGASIVIGGHKLPSK